MVAIRASWTGFAYDLRVMSWPVTVPFRCQRLKHAGHQRFKVHAVTPHPTPHGGSWAAFRLQIRSQACGVSQSRKRPRRDQVPLSTMRFAPGCSLRC